MNKPVLAYLPPDPLHGDDPIQLCFGDLIERRESDGSGSIWHAVLGELYNNKGAPVIVAMLRSTEAVRVTAFPRKLLQYSRRSDAERCSVFTVRAAPQQPPPATIAAAAQPASPPQAVPPSAPPPPDFPPGMMSVGMDIDTLSGSVSIHGRKRDSDTKDDDSSNS